MNPTHSLTTLVSVEPIGWLLVLLSLYFRGERRSARLQRGGLAIVRVEPGTDASYRSLGLFTALKLVGSLAYLVLARHLFAPGVTGRAGELLAIATFWLAYVAATVCVFFVVAEVLKTSLSPLPGLTAAVLIVFRWAAIVAFILALTAHLPLYGIHSMSQWLNEVDTSFTLCVCSFEVALLYLLIKQLNRLGLLLRSRPVGIALGLAMIGCMDLLATVTQNLPPRYGLWFSTFNELGLFFAFGMWAFYLIAPEPARTAPRLTPNSRLMRWEEIARQFGTAGNQGESDPFISRVESTVAAILKKHNVGNYS